jgi:FixJ family two-component response regulator
MVKKVNVPEAPLISIVDDDVSVRRSTVRLVRSLGMRAETFASAEEFANSDQIRHTACLILDVRMPGMTGLELQERLLKAGKRIPIIFITAHADEAQKKTGDEGEGCRFSTQAFYRRRVAQRDSSGA